MSKVKTDDGSKPKQTWKSRSKGKNAIEIVDSEPEIVEKPKEIDLADQSLEINL